MKNHPQIPKCRKTVLPSGIRVLTDKVSEMRSVSVGILVRAGSGDEAKNEAGISHFIEHMMFKGTPRRSAFQIAKELDAVGGKINAMTGKESTMFYSVILDEHIDIAVSVLSDIFLNSLFDAKELETERGVILEEIRMYEDTPDELIHDLLAETILGDHPMARPTIGTYGSVKALSRDMMLSYMRKLYSPESIIISVAGNVDHEEIVQKFMPLCDAVKFAKKVERPLAPKVVGAVKIKQKKTEQIHLCLGTRSVSQLDPERYSYMALDNILGGSMSSRLFQEIREKRGLAYSVYSYMNAQRDFGTFNIYAGTSAETYMQVIELILKECGRIKKEGITDEELKRAKEFVKGSLVLGLESTSSRMGWVSRSEFYYDRVLTIDEVFASIDKTTRDDIIKLASENFKTEYLALAMIGDFEKEPRVELSL